MSGALKKLANNPLLSKVVSNRIVIFSILVFSIVNATLRFTDSGMTSVYRLVSPFLFVLIMFLHWKWFKREIVIVAIGIIYGLTVSIIFYGHISFDMWVFLAYLCILYAIVRIFYFTSIDFASEFFRFLNVVTICTLVLCWLQYFVRVPYPFLHVPNDPGVNVFMSNENELAAPFACMFAVYMYKILFERKWKYIPIVINIAFFVYINDAKLSLIGMALTIVVYVLFGLYILLSKKFGISATKFNISLIITSVILIVLIIIINPEIKFRDHVFSIKQLILNEILDIITLNPTYGSGGSMIDRTNAIIFGIIELKKTMFFGIGWGNSMVMLQKPEYLLMTAASMHNIVFQFLVEFGIYSIICYCALIVWLIRCIKNIRSDKTSIMKVAFAVGFIFTSSQSSVGILSNYYVWLVVFFVAFAGKSASPIMCRAND